MDNRAYYTVIQRFGTEPEPTDHHRAACGAGRYAWRAAEIRAACWSSRWDGGDVPRAVVRATAHHQSLDALGQSEIVAVYEHMLARSRRLLPSVQPPTVMYACPPTDPPGPEWFGAIVSTDAGL